MPSKVSDLAARARGSRRRPVPEEEVVELPSERGESFVVGGLTWTLTATVAAATTLTAGRRPKITPGQFAASATLPGGTVKLVLSSTLEGLHQQIANWVEDQTRRKDGGQLTAAPVSARISTRGTQAPPAADEGSQEPADEPLGPPDDDAVAA